MNKTINGEWTVTFHTVEGEVPALAAIQTKGYPDIAIVLHLQCCILGFLDKNAVLKVKQAMKLQSSISCYISQTLSTELDEEDTQ